MTCKHGNHKTIEECRAFEEGRAEAEKKRLGMCEHEGCDKGATVSVCIFHATKDIDERSRILAEVRNRDASFIEHIQSHLKLGEIVVCKICGKHAKTCMEELAKLEGGERMICQACATFETDIIAQKGIPYFSRPTLTCDICGISFGD